jgi:predicted Zn-dependent peptidase
MDLRMPQTVQVHTLTNGMTLLGEPMEHVQSVAFVFLVPCGSARLPKDASGAGNVLLDWLYRGAGSRNSRQLIDALDGLGLHRSCSITPHHLVFGSSLESGNLAAALELNADILLRPRLDEDQFEPSRQLALQELEGLEDEPRQKVMTLVQEQFYPDPLGRPSLGRKADLENLTAPRLRDIVSRSFHPAGGMFAIAGRYDFDAVCRQLESFFGTQPTPDSAPIVPGSSGGPYRHIHHDGAQVHIGLITPTIPITHPDYYHAMAAVSVLSGSMSSRLFTEVREKRGLCYAVGARYQTLRDLAGISCYAGTTPDKAQETLDVILAEFRRLREGITSDELQRAQVGLKSSLIMQSESTASRSGGIASDFHLLGRVRPLEEIKQQLERLSADSVGQFLREHPMDDFTIVTIGPKEIRMMA